MGILERLASTLAGAVDVDDPAREEIEAALAEGGAGNWAAAEAALMELAGRRADAPAVHVALGEVRVRRGHDEAAVAAFGRAVDLAPQVVDGWLGLGEALRRLGRFEPAREALRKVLARTQDVSRRARAHVGRGEIALALDEPARAVRELRQAAELAPADYGVAHALGRALAAAGEPEAFSWLVRAAHAPSANPRWVEDAAAAAPTAADAEALLRHRLDAAAPVPLLPEQRARLEAARAVALCRAGLVAEALPLARAAAAAAPDSPAAANALSLCEERAGHHAQALAAAARAEALGVPADRARLVRLALGAQDPQALREAAARAPAAAAAAGNHAAPDPLAEAARAFADSRAREDDLLLLAEHAPGDEARRFLVAALDPGELPGGNLYAALAFARQLAARAPELAPLLPHAARAVEAFDRPLLVAVMGEFNAGKSSFVNALVGEAVAEVGVTPTTATINVLRYGPRGARVLYHDGRARELAADEVRPFLARLDDAQASAVRTVELFVPLPLFQKVEVVDTPGLNSLRAEHEAVARGFLTEADAIIWLFAVGQAAKATERDALALAQAAGKRVLGVLNKADQASPEEIAEIERHVTASLGDLVELLLPLSARDALKKHQPGDSPRDDGGLGAVQAALEERFFTRARALKRQTALGALQRFLAEAQALGEAARPPAPAAEPPGALAASAAAVAGAIAAERVRLPARIDAALAQAAAEVAELMQPSLWPFGERRSLSRNADREFLLDLLDDAVFEATAVTAREVEAAAAGGPAFPIAAFIDRFRAYCRGFWRGGLADDLLREQQGLAGRADPGQLQRVFAGRLPSVHQELLAPLEAAAQAAAAQARASHAAAAGRLAMRALIWRTRLGQPLDTLAQALRSLQE